MTRKQTALWKCRDGTRIRICDMSGAHLANAIACMERRADWSRRCALADGYSLLDTLHGDAAIDSAEDAIDSLENDDGPDEFMPPIYEKLLAEQDRREDKEPM